MVHQCCRDVYGAFVLQGCAWCISADGGGGGGVR